MRRTPPGKIIEQGLEVSPATAPSIGTDAGNLHPLPAGTDPLATSATAGVAAYASGTTYAAGAVVAAVDGAGAPALWVSQVGSNTGHTPASSPTQWGQGITLAQFAALALLPAATADLGTAGTHPWRRIYVADATTAGLEPSSPTGTLRIGYTLMTGGVLKLGNDSLGQGTVLLTGGLIEVGCNVVPTTTADLGAAARRAGFLGVYTTTSVFAPALDAPRRSQPRAVGYRHGERHRDQSARADGGRGRRGHQALVADDRAAHRRQRGVRGGRRAGVVGLRRAQRDRGRRHDLQSNTACSWLAIWSGLAPSVTPRWYTASHDGHRPQARPRDESHAPAHRPPPHPACPPRQGGAAGTPQTAPGPQLRDAPPGPDQWDPRRRATCRRGLSPPAALRLYGFPRLTPAAPASIALIELGGGFAGASIVSQFTAWGLKPPHVETVGVLGAGNAYTGDPQSADVEVTLDLCVAAGIYAWMTGTNAVVHVLFAPNSAAGFAAAVRAALALKPRPAALSISWGGAEDQWAGADLDLLERALEAAVAQGVHGACAAGDAGSGDGDASGDHADFPGRLPGRAVLRRHVDRDLRWHEPDSPLGSPPRPSGTPTGARPAAATAPSSIARPINRPSRPPTTGAGCPTWWPWPTRPRGTRRPSARSSVVPLRWPLFWRSYFTRRPSPPRRGRPARVPARRALCTPGELCREITSGSDGDFAAAPGHVEPRGGPRGTPRRRGRDAVSAAGTDGPGAPPIPQQGAGARRSGRPAPAAHRAHRGALPRSRR